MFGHLKEQDFVNLMEGAELSPKHRAHLDSCASCSATWRSLGSLHSELVSMDDDIPEPDWAEFRSSVRDRVLSRSIQRETAVRRWTGWAIRPAMAWALSLMLVAGITVVTVVWNSNHGNAARSFEAPAPEPSIEASMEAGPERSLFDDLVQLGDEQQEQLQEMLESSQKGSRYR